mmetsp:Transcript_32191/g.44658  ORF Transcript_32191/g.44658 Transcript_32191/m.44658 type:complete len:208 (-) Transcript_32191:335-958(-)|eukprot:CAMPEP_0196570838 /NCGR_PEP_ID=MMETSP1081-20130531/1016_1 /TAXON_ID=36882 /ORGANISM="Pyramimonas amylifera, Strain CCMP720" /LENGTH=207 /DNA_ID=CAMNT_0041887517 /DNA_START=146 /DNA_END=769 /DNA_ORIENTATION=+
MFRRAAQVLSTRGSRAFTPSVTFAADEAVSKHTSSAFLKSWADNAPSTLDPPNFSATFIPPPRSLEAEAAGIPEKLNFSFYLPHATEMNNEKVDMVLVPGTDGDFGVLPGHVPTIAQLKPGVVAVHKDDKDIVKYFVSSGFAFIHADSSTELCAVEAVPLEQIDAAAVKESLAEYNNKLINAKDDYEKAAAQIGIEVCSAMNAAVGN